MLLKVALWSPTLRNYAWPVKIYVFSCMGLPYLHLQLVVVDSSFCFHPGGDEIDHIHLTVHQAVHYAKSL